MTVSDPTPLFAACVTQARTAKARGDERAFRNAREDAAAIVLAVAKRSSAKYAYKNNADAEDVEGEMNFVVAIYVDAVIGGDEPIPNSLRAKVNAIANYKAIDAMRDSMRRGKRDAARFGDGGSCTPIGAASNGVTAGMISKATTTPSHENAVINRVVIREIVALMTYEGQVATMGHFAIGLSTTECCDAIGCSPGALHVRAHRTRTKNSERFASTFPLENS